MEKISIYFLTEKGSFNTTRYNFSNKYVYFLYSVPILPLSLFFMVLVKMIYFIACHHELAQLNGKWHEYTPANQEVLLKSDNVASAPDSICNIFTAKYK